MAGKNEHLIDFDRADHKAKLWQLLKSCNGLHRVTVVRYRPRRSDRANAYYWGVAIETFRTFLAEQGQWFSPDDVHAFFKDRFLREEVVNEQTGEVVGHRTGSTAKLTTVEFADYLDHVFAWLNDTFGVVVPAPNEYRDASRRPTERTPA